MQLLTIPFSHFCEKARWALDRSGADYREVRFAPVVQKFAVAPLGSQTVPVLVDAPRVTRGSNDILRLCDELCDDADRLFPIEADQRRQVEELVERFDEIVAPEVRLWFYSWATADQDRLRKYGSHGLPPSQRALMRHGLPAISKMLGMHFKLDESTHARAAKLVSQEFDFVSGMLADGRRYLVSDRFSAADLAFASFVGSTVAGPIYGGDRYSPPERPAELAEQSAAWADSAAGQWVRGLYEDHRLARAGSTSAQLLRPLKQNGLPEQAPEGRDVRL